ncbi:MAG: HEAT repeat domain-containing protein, partial [Bacteriovorax sp.]|nr:HEAT repeat domain-containing protein [Bacteriovorax sp.]
ETTILALSLGDSMSTPEGTQKKILENPFVGSLIVPIAIVLFGSLIIFGITKMLSSERSYKDLVEEIQSKTFGNKWVAAYELSKQINSSQIPESEYPWLVQNLTSAYKQSIDPRTRGFIIAALGALKTNIALPTLQLGLLDLDLDVRFHAIVAIANMPKGIDFDWGQLLSLLNANEPIIKQAAILALATHAVPQAHAPIRALINDTNLVVKYAAATALIPYKEESAVPVLKEILTLNYPDAKARVLPPALDAQQITDLKLGVLSTLQKTQWAVLNDIILDVSNNDLNNSVATKAKEVFNLLKK